VIGFLARARRRARENTRGQATIEMALILPVLLLIVLGTLEFGFMMDHKLTIQYASREAARNGASLANGGGQPGCGSGQSPNAANVDKEIIAAAQRILESSDSRIDLPHITDIRIFKSDLDAGDTDGREQFGADPVNVWHYRPGNIANPQVDGVPLDFFEFSHGWDVCGRVNYGSFPDSVGVSIRYVYFSRTPLSALMNLLQVGMYDFTAFELNPTNQ